jgi:hypothetical protein
MPGLLRGDGTLLACQCHQVLCGSFDLELAGNVLSGFWHAVHAITLFHQSLLTKRQPMVVSYTALLRLKALSILGMTKGARLMLSTPPAIIKPVSPDAMALAAVPTASRARAT